MHPVLSQVLLLLLAVSPFHPIFAAGEPSASAPEAKSENLSKLLPIVFYTPDTSFGGGAFLIRNLDGESSKDPSQLVAFATVTVKRQIISIIEPKFYWDEGRWEWASKIGGQDFPSTFYGRGNLELDKDEGEDYKEIRSNFETRLKNIYYDRHFWELEYGTSQQRYVPGTESPLINQELDEWGTRSRQQSLRLGLGFDSRNGKIRPTEGHILNVSYKKTALLGEKRQQSYGVAGVDYKLYMSLDAQRSMAIQILATEQQMVEVPFYVLQGIGGNQLLRGFYGNQFRDYAIAVSQVEWRSLWSETWGYRWFFGTGGHAQHLRQLASRETKIAGGLGVDYFLDPKTKNNLRFDLGWSPGQIAVYFLYGNAF